MTNQRTKHLLNQGEEDGHGGGHIQREVKKGRDITSELIQGTSGKHVGVTPRYAEG